MECEVVVVGAGIGGLTVAALLAARGMNVCVLERQSQVGGCVTNFEFQDYAFEPTSGLYTGWDAGGIHERIFSELPVKPPEVRRLSPAYVARLPDQTEIAVTEQAEAFEETIRAAFPECADAAVAFYGNMEQLIVEPAVAGLDDTVGKHLVGTSKRFQSFIDVQLQTFDGCASDRCSYLAAANSLTMARHGMWAVRGGAQALADCLAESLKTSGGSLRLNSTVLRLAYGADGSPVRVDLLSGERVIARRAIVSNLTIWDTYGRLVGLNRTPPSVSAQLKLLEGSSAYVIFLGMDAAAASRLGAEHLLLCDDAQSTETRAPGTSQIVFAAAPEWYPRAPEGKRAVTVWTRTDPEDWFAFHRDETAHEEQDQAMLERLWPRLHTALPELGDGIEVIETATPRTFHDTTRRKFGMVGGLCSTPARMAAPSQFGITIFPNLFLVGDTVSAGNDIDSVCRSALAIAQSIAPRL